MFVLHWGKLLVVFQSIMCQIPATLHPAIFHYQLRFKHIFFSALQQTLAHSVTSPTAGDSSAPAATSCTLWTGRAGLRPDMTACRTEQTWCPSRQQMKSSSSRDRWTRHTLTSGLGFPRWWEEHGVTLSSSLCHLTLGVWNFLCSNVKMSFVSPEMQQDFLSGRGGKWTVHLVRRPDGGLHKLGSQWTCRVRCRIVYTRHLNLNIYPCNQNWNMFSNRDAQTGICAAKIKEETGEFGKWRGHMCRYERPYMCERLLNSKMDSSGNTRTWYLVFLCRCGTSFTSLLLP